MALTLTRGTFGPFVRFAMCYLLAALRPSLKAIAIAWERDFTFGCLPAPDFNVPALNSCMTRRTLRCCAVFLAISALLDAQPGPLLATDRASPFHPRLVVGHTHHPESVGGVRGPVVFWAEIDEAMLVALGVIGPERVDAGGAMIFVEPNAWKQPPRHLDAVHGGGTALVRHHLGVEAGRLQRRLVGYREHLVVRFGVVRQHHQCATVAARSQPLDMRRKRLALRFVEIQDPDLAADELGDPDAGMIGPRAGAADIPERAIGDQRIGS